ncbi:MAG: LysM peptidoglycan-binding domain-containing protein [Desulfarculaceae bacterium]|nr:LysM peptidoglycan-binding domain-containing protein [Desulfarculaceae bacterium]MCF8073098.1 LysM peptidoglycan-binding domain-containing protein [Desulfarculaceae bacterium]MCF8101817.1 LysM peptidoglycan-binding domain-containing protein [Desulfarculaceae bacterium]MCF8115344.1 LysM peptidoglycan-binding domain-containing protein [Desulfarculaceae bacterium]
MLSSYDDMGPRVDLGGDPPHPGASPGQPRRTVTPQAPVLPPKQAKNGPGALGLVSLMLSLLALAVAIWVLLSQPEMIPPPPVSPSVVPGATAERVAKMEKDVQDLMLRMVTLDKELKAVASKAGSVTKLTQLSNRVAALQDRLDALTVDKKISSLENKSKPGAPAKAAPAKPAAKKAAKAPERSKQVYTVRRGDTLFTVAQRYKVTMRDLKQWNNLRSNVIMVGQKLVIYK